MTLRPFIPLAEQLESKLLMAVVHSMPGMEIEPYGSTPTSVDGQQMARVAELTDVMFSTQRQGNDTLLIVHLETDQSPRMIQLVGGESAMTREDGTAQLLLPRDVRMIDLMIDNEAGEQIPLVRLEFSSDGEIVRQTSLDRDSQTLTPQGSNLAVALNHDSETHSAALSGVLSAGYSTSSHSFGMPEGHEDSLTGNMVDLAMAHEFGMATLSDDAEHEGSDTDFAHGEQVAANQDLPSADDEDDQETESEHSSAEADAEHASEPPASIAIAPVPEPSEEDYEVLAAGWTAGQEADRVAIVQVNPVLPSIRRPAATTNATVNATTPPPSQRPLADSPPADSPPADSPIVMVSYIAETVATQDVNDDSQSSRWPFAGAIMVSCAAAAAAFALDRRAEQYIQFDRSNRFA